jgi:2-dehydropantoate 2-reductase
MTISVLTFGAGAIGTYIGGSLALAGNRVVFLERPPIIDVLSKHGLRMDVSSDKRRGIKEPLIVQSDRFECGSSLRDAIARGPFDIAIFAIKSFDTNTALKEIFPYADKMPPVLCLQNGVDNEPAIAGVLGPDRVIAGSVTGSISRLGAGNIILEKARGIGIAAGHSLSTRLVTIMNEAALNAHIFPRAADMKWSKVLANLPGSATSAILNISPTEVFANPKLYELERRMSYEALEVMAAQGIYPVNLPGIPVHLFALAFRLPAFLARAIFSKVVGGGRGGKMPSFHIDLHAGRSTSEIEWLQGAVARHGEKIGIPTPVNRLLTDTLMAMVIGKIKIIEFSHQPEKLLNLLTS